VESWDRIVLDVCNIFSELTGAEAEAKRERSVIIPWIRDEGFDVYEFRLVIEHTLKDRHQKEFLAQPGRMNLRTIFNLSRRDRVLDLVSDLKRAKQIQNRIAEQQQKDETPNFKSIRVLMGCGHAVNIKYFKEPFGNTFRWVRDLSEYDGHDLICKDSVESRPPTPETFINSQRTAP